MDKIRATIKMRKATIEDFIWLDWDGNKKLKMGYPFYVIEGDLLSFRFVKLLDGDEKTEQFNRIKAWLSAERLYVLDPAFMEEDKIKIEKPR